MNFGLIILMFLLALVSIYQIEVTLFYQHILSTYFINKCWMLTFILNLTLKLSLTPKKKFRKNDITSV